MSPRKVLVSVNLSKNPFRSLSLNSSFAKRRPRSEARSPVKKSTTKKVASLTKIFLSTTEWWAPASIERVRKLISLENLTRNKGTAYEVTIVLPACYSRINLRYSLTLVCATGLESCKRPRLLKMALNFPNKESTDPAAKRVGQLQWTSEHDRLWNTVFPYVSLLIKNLRPVLSNFQLSSFGREKMKFLKLSR